MWCENLDQFLLGLLAMGEWLQRGLRGVGEWGYEFTAHGFRVRRSITHSLGFFDHVVGLCIYEYKYISIYKYI